MPIDRVFLGWDGACLPRVVRWLTERYGSAQRWDLSRVVLVTPGKRSGRRLPLAMIDPISPVPLLHALLARRRETSPLEELTERRRRVVGAQKVLRGAPIKAQKVLHHGPEGWAQHVASYSRIEPDLKVGERVLFGKYSGQQVRVDGTDLLVLGGYGHSRFREFVLGGVTRSMLHEIAIPTLMAH